MHHLILLASVVLGTLALPRPNTCVYDPQHVLTIAETDSLTLTCREYDAKGSAAIAVAIVNDLKGNTRPEFAVQLFKEWGIGHKDRNDGILILLALPPADRGVKVEVGYGLEGILNDGKVGAMVREQIPNLKAAAYGLALRNLMIAIGDTALPEAQPRPAKASEDFDLSNVLIGLGCALLVATGAGLLSYRRRKRKAKIVSSSGYLRPRPDAKPVPETRRNEVQAGFNELYRPAPVIRRAPRVYEAPPSNPVYVPVVVETPREPVMAEVRTEPPPARTHHSSSSFSPSHSSPSHDYGSSSGFGGFDGGSSGGGGSDNSF